MAEDNPEEPDDVEEEWISAVEDCNFPRVQRILRSGRMDVNRQCFRGRRWAALHVVSLQSAPGNLRIMRVLLEHGANANQTRWCSPLHLCIRKRRVDAARVLLEHGADPDIHMHDRNGCLALHYVSEKHEVDLMQMLIEHGATVDSKDDFGSTPLQYCVCWDDSGLQKPVVMDAALLLLENGSNPNNRSWSIGYSILLTACIRRNRSLVRLLMQHGATVDEKDPLSGETNLHKLAKSPWHDVESIELLLEHGANPRIRDNEGKLALDVACARKVDSSRDMASNIDVIYVLFQRMIGDASLSIKKRNHMC